MMLFAAAAVLLVAFVVIEQRVAHPLLPLRVVLDRNRGGSFLASLLVGTALLRTFLSLTHSFHGPLHYSALQSGVPFFPSSAAAIPAPPRATRPPSPSAPSCLRAPAGAPPPPSGRLAPAPPRPSRPGRRRWRCWAASEPAGLSGAPR